MNNIKLKIGKKYEIEIEKIVFGGEGLGHIDGFTVFVPMSVPGDILEVEIISLKKTYARALITKIIKPSADRIDDLSKISFEDFDGCDFAMLKYEKQLYYKNLMLEEVLTHIGKLDLTNTTIEKIIGCDTLINYRNKTAEPLVKKNGKITTGFYSKKSHNVFTAKENLLRSQVAEKIINAFLLEINSYQGTKKEFKVYNEINNSGFLKHIVIRNNEKNEVLLTIVINKKSQIKELKKVLEKLYNENNEIISVYISIKNEQNNVILGEKNKLLLGNDYLEEEINGINFKIYPDSFFQINKKQAIKLYNKGIEYLGESKKNTVIDAFSGTGTIAMILSKNVNKVIGIESVKSSVEAGNITIKENNIKHVNLLHGKVEKVLPNVLKAEKVEAIIFDPPRKGIDQKALYSTVKNNIKKIVYISCNPATFARDCKFLVENGYHLEKVGAVDMFPQTNHIEVVGVLTKSIK